MNKKTYNDVPDIIKNTITFAEKCQDRANKILLSSGKKGENQLKVLLENPVDRVALMKIIDQCLRLQNSKRMSNQLIYLFDEYGIPSFISKQDRAMLWVMRQGRRRIPYIFLSKIIKKIREFTSPLIISGEKKALHKHLARRKKEGLMMNINYVGEAVHGEDEAQRRINSYVELLKDPEVEHLSVKISSICSQLNLFAFEETVSVLVERLSILYIQAQEHFFVDQKGHKGAKFISLDMKDYCYGELTLEAFMRTLEQPSLKGVSAGITLQAYIPESFRWQKKLTDWAQKRVHKGGSPIKLRIVKGANLEMERIEAELNSWHLATYSRKHYVDANFKRMVEYALKPERSQCVHIGVASHNIFDLAFAYELAQQKRVADYLVFEMLEGMAEHVQIAFQEMVGNKVLLYAPVVKKEHFIDAMAYLFRRFDENTGRENFLHYCFDLTIDSHRWEYLKNQFIKSYIDRQKVSTEPHRTQNKVRKILPEKSGASENRQFTHESDTDWSLASNRQWAKEIRKKWKKKPENPPIPIPLVVAGQNIYEQVEQLIECIDLSQLPEKVVMAKCAMACREQGEKAVAAAEADPDGWRSKSFHERHEKLKQVAQYVRLRRGDLIGVAAADTGKIFTESDKEVSEAIDFLEYYPYSLKIFDDMDDFEIKGKGVVVVISPWNFPLSIPTGGIAAALSAGNTVIFKPSSEAVLTGWVLCQCFWDAGITKNTLQFLPGSGKIIGTQLVNHKKVDSIIFTGSTNTALTMLRDRPDACLSAETGGKNATIVTALADKDQAIKNVVHSAFSHSGQKCSATSLLILEKEVYEDKNFLNKLIDAVKSLPVGSVWEFKNVMGPLIQQPKGKLLYALNVLEPKESWALAPENISNNPLLWKPGIRYGVTSGSICHRTEFFGPMLSVMEAQDIDHAMELVNLTGYGLTSALGSLDKREHKVWKETIQAGNLYINQGTTGAIVLRQPFGGYGKSSFGPGLKAGGPHYALQFMDFHEKRFPPIPEIKRNTLLYKMAERWTELLIVEEFHTFWIDLEKAIHALYSYAYHAEEYFLKEHDFFHLRGQDNIFHFIPLSPVVVRLHQSDSLFDVLARVVAVKALGSHLIVSIPPDMNNFVTFFLLKDEGKPLLADADVFRHSDEDLASLVTEVERIRYASPERVSPVVYEAAAKNGCYIARNKPLMEGRIELLYYVKEQTLSVTTHRYGSTLAQGVKD